MKITVLLLLTLLGCSAAKKDRALKNAAARVAKLSDTLKVEISGGSILSFEAATSSQPARVLARSQSLDLRIDVTDTGCDPVAIVLSVQNLPAVGMTPSRRVLLGALSAEAEATRAASGASITFTGDPNSPDWTPTDAEATFETERLSGVTTWSLLSNRGRGVVQTEPGEHTMLVEAANTTTAGACVSIDTPLGGPLANAALVIRHRFQSVVPSEGFRFAVWGNNGGDAVQRRLIAESVEEAGVHFVVINGDLTADGTDSALRAAQEQLDSILTVPYFPAIGNNEAQDTAFVDVFGQSSFAFDIADVRLIMLDAASGGLTAEGFEQLGTWLKDSPLSWLDVPAPSQRIVFSHVPPFDPSGLRGEGFSRRAEAGRLIAALARTGVKHLIASQFAVFKTQKIAGVEVVHTGGGGKPMESDDSTGHHWLEVAVGHGCTPATGSGLAFDALCTPTETGSDCGPGLFCRNETARCADCVSVTAVPIE